MNNIIKFIALSVLTLSLVPSCGLNCFRMKGNEKYDKIEVEKEISKFMNMMSDVTKVKVTVDCPVWTEPENYVEPEEGQKFVCTATYQDGHKQSVYVTFKDGYRSVTT